jgi:hypothetical protein
MTSENPVADRLVSDARKKEARAAASPLDVTALVLSLVGLAAVGWIPLAAVLGLAGIVVGIVASRKPGNVRMAWGAVIIGAVAILAGIFYVLHNTGSL